VEQVGSTNRRWERDRIEAAIQKIGEFEVSCRRDERKYYRRGCFWSVFEQLPHCRRVLAKGQTAGTRPLSRLHGKANRASGAPSLAGDVVEGAADVSGER